MQYLVALLSVLVAAGCGDLQPEDPGSKLNSAPNSANVAVNSSNGQPNSTANNVTPVDAQQWGTTGPATNDGKSPDGHALCTLDDVTTNDLGTTNSSDVPADPWDGSPVADGRGRCGDDDETLGWRLFNCERIGRGLTPLACDQRLVWMSREHTLDMIRQDYFRHDNPAGESPHDRLDRHGIAWTAAAENLALGPSIIHMHHEWMDSQGHRENILGGYAHVGLGTEPHRGGFLSTAMFNTPP